MPKGHYIRKPKNTQGTQEVKKRTRKSRTQGVSVSLEDCSIRVCLKCQKEFPSTGRFNKICGNCHSQKTYDTPKSFSGQHRKPSSTISHINERTQ